MGELGRVEERWVEGGGGSSGGGEEDEGRRVERREEEGSLVRGAWMREAGVDWNN